MTGVHSSGKPEPNFTFRSLVLNQRQETERPLQTHIYTVQHLKVTM